MNRGEFEGLKARFAPDIATWPAPFRQEALLFLAAPHDDAINDDEKLDRLVLEAITTPTDERVLVRNVMAGIAKPGRRMVGLMIDPRSWPIAATAASMVIVVTLSAASGYVAAERQTDTSDDALLAFAVGIPPSELTKTTIFTQEEGSRP
jgi:hypothetical protein